MSRLQWLSSATPTLDQFSNLEIIITQEDRDWADSVKKGRKKIPSLEKLLKPAIISAFMFLLIMDARTVDVSLYCGGDVVMIHSQW
ncbi:MAG: hypothetical protein ABJA70_15855 [Chryseolinea sp.]